LAGNGQAATITILSFRLIWQSVARIVIKLSFV
jgi:hypothetical protein